MARRRSAPIQPARRVVQFSVALDNTAGTLADLCAAMRRSGVNVEALMVSDNTDCGWVRLIATPAVKARAALARGKYTVCAQLVVGVEAADEPGELERLARALAKAGVNVNYMYGSTVTGRPSRLFMGVSDADRAVRALS